MVKLKVNRNVRTFDGDPNMPLLWYLRDMLGLTGTKFGCGVALCGACTAHKDGQAVRSRVTPMSAIAGSEIRTIEDLGVNPEITHAQFERAAVFGTRIVRNGEITAKNDAIQQSNFNDYPVARINEVPAQTNVYITKSSGPPAGVGEPGVPPFVAAFCNAIFAATGKRVRDLPLSSNNLFA